MMASNIGCVRTLDFLFPLKYGEMSRMRQCHQSWALCKLWKDGNRIIETHARFYLIRWISRSPFGVRVWKPQCEATTDGANSTADWERLGKIAVLHRQRKSKIEKFARGCGGSNTRKVISHATGAAQAQNVCFPIVFRCLSLRYFFETENRDERFFRGRAKICPVNEKENAQNFGGSSFCFFFVVSSFTFVSLSSTWICKRIRTHN